MCNNDVDMLVDQIKKNEHYQPNMQWPQNLYRRNCYQTSSMSDLLIHNLWLVQATHLLNSYSVRSTNQLGNLQADLIDLIESEKDVLVISRN